MTVVTGGEQPSATKPNTTRITTCLVTNMMSPSLSNDASRRRHDARAGLKPRRVRSLISRNERANE
jgi:hypothetical protein